VEVILFRATQRASSAGTIDFDPGQLLRWWAKIIALAE
jgi:hypothetical protein